MTAVNSTEKLFEPVERLAKRESEALGGIHAGMLEGLAANGWVFASTAESQFAGMIAIRPSLVSDPRLIPIIATAVPNDLRRLHVGAAILDDILHRYGGHGRIVQACCRQGLPSNRFWNALGFIPAMIRLTTAARGKPLIVWRSPVTTAPTAVRKYIPPRKPRGPGGRWVPANRPDLIEQLSDDPHDIAEVLERSGFSTADITAALNRQPIALERTLRALSMPRD